MTVFWVFLMLSAARVEPWIVFTSHDCFVCDQDEGDEEEENVMDLEALKLRSTHTVRSPQNKITS